MPAIVGENPTSEIMNRYWLKIKQNKKKKEILFSGITETKIVDLTLGLKSFYTFLGYSMTMNQLEELQQLIKM